MFYLCKRNGQRNVFQWWFPILTLTPFFSALQIRNNVKSNTGGLNGWFPMSYLNKMKSTLSFWLFWMRTKTEVCPTSIGVDDSPSLNKIIHHFPDGEI